MFLFFFFKLEIGIVEWETNQSGKTGKAEKGPGIGGKSSVWVNAESSRQESGSQQWTWPLVFTNACREENEKSPYTFDTCWL